jgi:LuxR family maltose regulon positive regulatory protein
MKYLVREDGGIYQASLSTPLLTGETPAWYAWLEEVTVFTYTSRYGTFSARKEAIAHGRGGTYWRAYRKSKGRLYRVYLGKSEQLTMARLNATARELARRIERATTKREQSEQETFSRGYEVQKAVSSRTAYHLLQTKLYIPAPQPHLVTRSRLVHCLDQGVRNNRLTLLSAVAGAGKTTLLSNWARQSSRLVAWVTLDKEDNDSVRFWSYVIAALQQASLDSVAYVGDMLRALPVAELQNVLGELLNVLTEEPREIALLLDDYHLIETPPLHDSLVFFIEHLPTHVHLILASRHDPPFALTRLRVSHRLFELHTNDLSFTLTEAQAFFAQTEEHFVLADDDLARLLEQTEGWIAGIQMAALSLHEQPDVSRFLASFTGKQRFMQHYLFEEVLKQQPQPVQYFLSATSILERFTADLCDALTGESNGSKMLEYLLQKNLFLISLSDEGDWYRYHHLLTDALSSRLRQVEPEQFLAYHRLASAWYERQGMIEEALHHALVAGEFGRVADLLELLVEMLLRQNEFTNLARWRDLLPPELLAQRPWLHLAWARMCIASGQLEQAAFCLRNLAEIDSARIKDADLNKFRGRRTALDAHFAASRGEVQKALDCAREALVLLPENDQEWRVSVQAALGGAYLHGGQLAEAEQVLSKVIVYYLQHQNIYLALTTSHTLGRAQSLLGRLDLAHKTYLRGIQIAARHGLTHSAVMGHIYAGYGTILYEWNDLKAAQEQLEAGIELARRGANTIQELDCTLTLTNVKLARNEAPEALDLLRRAEELALQINDPFFIDFIARRPVIVWLAANDIEAASRCARTTGLYRYSEVEDIGSLPATLFLFIELIMLIRLSLAQNDLSRAQHLLQQLQPLLAAGQLLQWHILHALTLCAEQRTEEAIQALAHALESAEPNGYMRTFIDSGPAIRPLLKLISNLKPLAHYSLHYVRQLLTALGERSGESTQDETGDRLLGEREFMVLRYLAQGYSNQEIAQHLVLSKNTIKTYTKRIYSKLQVHSRTQAIACAREQGLL